MLKLSVLLHSRSLNFFKKNILLITIISAAFCFYAINLGGQGYSLDEPETITVIKTVLQYGYPSGWDGKVMTWSDPASFSYINGHNFWTWQPWLTFYLAAPFYAIYGASNVGALKIPFGLFGAFSIGMFYILAKNIFKRTWLTILLSTQLLFLLPYFLYMRQIHYFSISAFFSLSLLWFLLRFIRQSLSKKMLFLLFLCGLFLFQSNYLIWISCLPLLFAIAIWKKNKTFFILLTIELVLGFLWFYYLRPYNGTPLAEYDGSRTIIVHIEALFSNLSYLNSFIFPFILALAFLFTGFKQKQILIFLILLAWIGQKLLIYSIFEGPHGRYLVDIMPPIVLLYGYIYQYLWEKRQYYLIIIIFLLVTTTNILSLVPVYILKTHESSVRIYPQEFAVELSGYYPSVYQQIGNYLMKNARPTDIFWANDYYSTYPYTNLPMLNVLCDPQTNHFYGPSPYSDPAKVRWYIFNAGSSKTLDNVACLGPKWQKYLQSNYQKKTFPLKEPVYGTNDIDIVNRSFPPSTIGKNQFIIYEKKQ